MDRISVNRRLLAIILLLFLINFMIFSQEAFCVIDAFDDFYSISEDTLLNVAAGAGVLSNDFDSEGDPLAVS